MGIETDKYRLNNRYYFKYQTKELNGLSHLTGKAIIHFKKDFRASYLIGRKYEDLLFIKELRHQRMSVGDFPGYNTVRVSFGLLSVIVHQQIPSWKASLSNVSGIYLITETKKGMQYVGSAYGGEGLWQRWSTYIKSGHGYNKELKDLLKLKGKDYTKNFQFSILEICDLNASEESVIEREVHWKEVLKTRDFGLNKN